jgi:ribosomal protein L40E
MFKTILGMQSALNIRVEPTNTSTIARADVGIFGQQTIPDTISLFIAWPVLLTQIWDLVRQNNLDEEALAVVEQVLITYSKRTLATSVGSASSGTQTPPGNASAAGTQKQFCMNCGAELLPPARFCTECGTQVVSA